VSAGQAIVTVVDFSDTWAFAAIPETDADHIGLGDTLRVRLPGGTVVSGKVFYKAAEADFATQRRCGAAEAGYTDDCFESAVGESEGSVCARDDGGSVD